MTPEFAYFLKVNVAFYTPLCLLPAVLLQGHLLQIAPYHLVGILWSVIALSADEYSGLGPGAGADGGSHTNVFGYFTRNDDNPR